MRRDHIDVVHLRWTVGADVPFADALGAMVELVDQGRIRHLALSNVTLAQLHQALAETAIVAVQNFYNVAFLPYCPLAIQRVAPPPSPALTAAAARHGATISKIALAWLLARSPVMLPIPGTSSPAHLDENWAAREIALSSQEVDAIAAAR